MDAFGNQSIVYQLVQSSVSYQQVNVNGVPTLVPVSMTPGMQPVAMSAAPGVSAAGVDLNPVDQSKMVQVKLESGDSLGASCESGVEIKQEPTDV